MRYLAKNPILLIFLYLYDFWHARHKKRSPPQPIRRILLSNLAHLGDVILATSLLPPLREKYPEAKIDFLCGSWAKELLTGHPILDEIHTLDHWRIARRQLSPFRYFAQKRKLISKLKKIKYDLAIDSYIYFPNASHLFWKASIPFRIGFPTGGSIYTHEVPWERKYLPESYRALLAPLSIFPQEMKPLLPKIAPASENSPYLVFHIGSDAKWKEWEGWRELLLLLPDTLIYFTGKGLREKMEIEKTIEGTSAINLADQLTFHQFIALIKGAQLLVSIDTSAPHLAAASGTATITLFDKKIDPILWAHPETIALQKESTSAAQLRDLIQLKLGKS